MYAGISNTGKGRSLFYKIFSLEYAAGNYKRTGEKNMINNNLLIFWPFSKTGQGFPMQG